MNIHPTAVVSPEAQLGKDVHIGPFCVVEPGVVLGDRCVLHSHAAIKSGCRLGEDNRVFERAVIGGLPQHVHAPGRPGRVIVGSGNTFREMVTVHRALEEDQATVIGDNNFLMVNVHVAHDCVLGSNGIFANNVMLAGHVAVADRAYLSGAVAVHQFTRIGSLAMVGGQAHVTKDVPPFVTVDGLSSYVVGLNSVGLRRVGFDHRTISQLKAAYRVIYRSGLAWKDVLARLQTEFTAAPAAHFYQFLSGTKRGIVSERRVPPTATLKIRRDSDDTTTPQVKAG